MKTDRRVSFAFLVCALILFLPLQVRAGELPAKLGWAELHYVSVPVEGFVNEVLVHVGQHVNKGDKLLQLNTTVLSADVDRARARVAALRPKLKDAERAYHDAQSLYEQTVLPEVELQKAKIAFDIATAKVNAAKAALVADKARLAQASQYAPWDGWVIERHVEHGQMIAGDFRSQPLIVMARADHMVAVSYATADACSHLAVGQAVKVRYQDKLYQGRVQSMALVPHSDSDKTYAVRVAFPVNSAVLHRPGESASVLLP